MAKSNALFIVESPNKAKTIGGYLAKDKIKVMATIGHVRELDTSKPVEEILDVKNSFKQKWRLNPSNKSNTKQLIDFAKTVDTVYLATDMDREGESIAWHVLDLFRLHNVRPPVIKRVVYHEVNEKAIREAMDHAGELNQDAVDAQFGRQGFDLLFGFSVSPLLWKKVRRGLSAGRVQSPALILLSQREREIQKFDPETYWQLFAHLMSESKEGFKAKVTHVNGQALGKLSFEKKQFTQEEVQQHKKALDELSQSSKPAFVVTDIKSARKSSKPKPPYITSTLQMDASRKLGWSASRTMGVAQKLFEGSGGEHGYITYHRTDSTMIADEPLREIMAFANEHYSEYVEKVSNNYRGRSKSQAEAHECIRCSDVFLTPEAAQGVMTEEMAKLYALIWQRTVASQLKPAIYDSTTLTIKAGIYTLKASGSVLVFKGYRAVYSEGEDVDSEKEDTGVLPKLLVNDTLKCLKNELTEHQTKPPARFNEASLVKSLEEYGIGRPSTYASIPKTLKERDYISIEGSRITVSEIGLVVADYLKEKLPEYVDYAFTSRMEEELDKVAAGEQNWVAMMSKFYSDFRPRIDVLMREEGEATGLVERTNLPCPKCGETHGGTVVVMVGKYGRFKCCSRGKKECGFIESLTEKPKPDHEPVGRDCPKCGSPLVKKKGYKGREFVGCSAFGQTKCDYAEDMNGNVRERPTDTKVKCPKCKKNNLLIRQARFGKMISCSGFPKCRNILKPDEFAKEANLTIEKVETMLS